MRKWIVYTDNGDYADIWARTAFAAMLKVTRLTLGRAKPYRVEEVAR